MVTVDGDSIRALAYPALVGSPRIGDRVLLNVGALEAGLGTGGYALVVAIPDRLPPDGDMPGHIVKSRYTPMQVMVASADEQGSAHHELLRSADSLDQMPVVVADLHSALPAVLAGIQGSYRTDRGSAPRVAYVMTDGGALPAWFSRTVAGLREAGWLAATISTGQSFGGDLEAVTVHSGLLTARHVVGADIAIVAQGPGNLGTGTRWGFSGVAAGEAVNAAATLDGRPVASLRLSFADPQRPPPGGLPPQPDRLRTGGAGRRRRRAARVAGAAGEPGGGGRRRRWRAGTAWSRSPSTASRRPCAPARSPYRPWAGALIRTSSTSWRRRRPAATRFPCLARKPRC